MPPTKSLAAALFAAVAFMPVAGAAQEHTVSLADALCILFRSSPSLEMLAAQTRLAQGTLLRTSGAFDVVASTTVQGQRVLLSNGTGVLTSEAFDDVVLQAGVGARTRDNFTWQLSGSLPLISSLDARTTVDQPLASATLTVPLTKLGRSAGSGAEEQASALRARAAAAAQADGESELVARVADSYWRWVGSYQQLEVTRRLEALALDQVKDVDQLIAQHARAPVDRLALVAAAENATATRMHAEQVVFEQQQLIWDALGLPPPANVAPASFELPTVPAVLLDAAPLARRAHALASDRPLLRSLADEVEAASTRADAASIARRPDLNLLLRATATRVERETSDENAAPPFAFGYYGGVGLQLAMPILNRTARGAFAEANAAKAQAQLGAQARRNSVDVRIDALSSALDTITRSYRERSRAAEQFEQAFESERIKFRLGTATAIEVVLAEQQYMNACLETVNERVAYAVTVVRLLHEAGALTAAIHSRDATAVASALTNPSL